MQASQQLSPLNASRQLGGEAAAVAAAVGTAGAGDPFLESLRRLSTHSPMAVRVAEVARVRASMRRYAMGYESACRVWAEAESMLGDPGAGAAAAVELAGSLARYSFDALGSLRLELLHGVVAARNAGARERHRALMALTVDGTAVEPFAEKVCMCEACASTCLCSVPLRGTAAQHRGGGGVTWSCVRRSPRR